MALPFSFDDNRKIFIILQSKKYSLDRQMLLNLKTKQMKKSDLKTGMIVEDRSGERALVMKNVYVYDKLKDCIFYTNSGTYMKFKDYNNDMTTSDSICNIDKVYTIRSASDLKRLDVKESSLLWERTPELIYHLDGIEYSESTLRSIIKKATEL